MSPKYDRTPEVIALQRAVGDARILKAEHEKLPADHPKRIAEDHRAQQDGYPDAGTRLANEINMLDSKLRHAREKLKARGPVEATAARSATPSEGKQRRLTEFEAGVASKVGSIDFTDVRAGTQIIPGATLKMGPVTPAAPAREAARQVAAKTSDLPPAPAKTPAKTPDRGSTTVLSRARQEAAARELRAEDTVTEAEHAAAEEMARMRRYGDAWAQAEGKDRQAARARAVAQERPLMEALRALVAAREEHQEAGRALRELIRHEEARAVLRGRTRERFGRLMWWQKPGGKITGITLTGLAGLVVGELTTGVVGLFFTWVGQVLGIGG